MANPSKTISFIAFVCSPDFPYLPKNFWGWKLAQQIVGGSADTNSVVLVSFDGYILQDKNGFNLIPKEAE